MGHILTSPQLHAVEQPIADHVGLLISPFRNCSEHLNVIYFLNWSAQTILDLLSGRREALIAFGKKLALQRAPPDEEGGEFPVGEALHPADRNTDSRAISIGNGFGVTYLTYHHLVLLNDPKFLRDYLKSLRIPYAVRFAKRLEAMVND